MEEMLEHDRQFGEDDYGDKREEAKAMQYVTAKFGKNKHDESVDNADETEEEQKQ